jgi:hypothetical protein
MLAQSIMGATLSRAAWDSTAPFAVSRAWLEDFTVGSLRFAWVHRGRPALLPTGRSGTGHIPAGTARPHICRRCAPCEGGAATSRSPLRPSARDQDASLAASPDARRGAARAAPTSRTSPDTPRQTPAGTVTDDAPPLPSPRRQVATQRETLQLTSGPSEQDIARPAAGGLPRSSAVPDPAPSSGHPGPLLPRPCIGWLFRYVVRTRPLPP